MVLVHLLSRLGVPLRAVHVDHRAHPQSARWANWVGTQLAALDVGLTIERLPESPIHGNLEEYWREARRERISGTLREGDVLVTAHHRDDQVETLLLQLLRGSGPVGLQSMPLRTTLHGRRAHVRPLLAYTRAQLAHYAHSKGVEWLDDPSNSDERFARNYLRHTVMPRLTERWPGAAGAIARSRELIAESVALNDVLARQDCVMRDDGRRLDWAALVPFDHARQANAVRYWLRASGVRLPTRERLNESLRQWREAAADRTPSLELAEGTVQRYRSELVFAPALTGWLREWTGSLVAGQALELPCALGSLSWQSVDDGRVDPHASLVDTEKLEGRDLTVRFRRGGEKLRRKGGHHQSLKHWFQDRGVPPILRGRLPLVYAGDVLVAIADRWIDARFRPATTPWPGQKVYRLIWRKSPAVSAK